MVTQNLADLAARTHWMISHVNDELHALTVDDHAALAAILERRINPNGATPRAHDVVLSLLAMITAFPHARATTTTTLDDVRGVACDVDRWAGRACNA